MLDQVAGGTRVMATAQRQLISYIAPSAPAARRPASGQEPFLRPAREAFPLARRAMMYTPMDLAGKSLGAIQSDLERIARDYAPCDIVAADIEAGTREERVRNLLAIWEELSHT